MSEAALHARLAWGVILCAVPVLAYLLVRPAPYGRHHAGGWGPTLPARAGWVLMEAPASLVFLGSFAAGDHAAGLVPLLLASLWQLHYAYRAFLYPLGLGDSRPIPAAIVASGFAFNVVNGWLNGRWTGHLGSYPPSWAADPRAIAGAILFVGGLLVNRHADAVLRSLRSRARGYAIPSGGLYELVSCPNYLGEIVQWAGWALATWSLAGLAFLVFTTANLLPRALAHHRWYRRTFPGYPPGRRALVPYLL